MPKVSMVMMTYNRENMVERAIKSYLSQTIDDFELILVDNGSTDRSGIICDEFGKLDSRVKVVHKGRGNIGSGRNAGIDVATGEYIAFVDDDDYALPKMFEVLYNNAIANDADISLCGSNKEVNGEVLPNFTFEGTEVLNTEEAVVELLKRQKYNTAPPSKMFRRTIFDKFRFLNEGNYDDITIMYKLFAYAKKVVITGQPLYVFYKHESNNSGFTLSNKWTDEILNEYIKAYEERTEYLREKLPDIYDYVLYTKWSYFISMCNKVKTYNLPNCENSYEYMYKCLKENYNEFFNSEYITEKEKELLQDHVK